MTTFDLAEVRAFAADIDARMTGCDHAEGTLCASLDEALQHYGSLCKEFREGVRSWGRAVFAGRVAFDPEVDRTWQAEGRLLFQRAAEWLGRGEAYEGPCYVLSGTSTLKAELWGLYKLLKGWVTPKLSAGPSARQRITDDPAEAARIRAVVDALPSLPDDWEPADEKQRWQFRRLRGPSAAPGSR